MSMCTRQWSYNFTVALPTELEVHIRIFRLNTVKSLGTSSRGFSPEIAPVTLPTELEAHVGIFGLKPSIPFEYVH